MFCIDTISAFWIHHLVLLGLQSDIVKNAKILQEIIFISILSKDFKDADHLIVPFIDKLMEEWNGLEMNHTKHAILSKDLVLELHDAINVFVVFLVASTVRILSPIAQFKR